MVVGHSALAAAMAATTTTLMMLTVTEARGYQLDPPSRQLYMGG